MPPTAMPPKAMPTKAMPPYAVSLKAMPPKANEMNKVPMKRNEMNKVPLVAIAHRPARESAILLDPPRAEALYDQLRDNPLNFVSWISPTIFLYSPLI